MVRKLDNPTPSDHLIITTLKCHFTHYIRPYHTTLRPSIYHLSTNYFSTSQNLIITPPNSTPQHHITSQHHTTPHHSTTPHQHATAPHHTTSPVVASTMAALEQQPTCCQLSLPPLHCIHHLFIRHCGIIVVSILPSR